MNRKTNIAGKLAIVLIVVIALLSGCANGTGNVENSPSPSLLPTTSVMPSPSPSPLQQGMLIAPGTEPGTAGQQPQGDSAAQNSQSAQLEQAQTLSTAAKNIVGVSDAVVVVTDDNRCLVALKLKSGTKLSSKMKSKLTAAIADGYQIRITDDRTIYDKVATLQQSMQIGKSVSYTEIKTEWDKIRMASE